MDRVGWTVGSRHPGEVYEERGGQQWAFIRSKLSPDWNEQPRRVLDFGCGPGRVLHHAIGTPNLELHACDIDQRAIDWMHEHLGAAVQVFRNEQMPPLPCPDAHFDLIYAFSVFTHLVESWSAWLLELHRLLKDDGLLIATVAGPGHSSLAGEPINEQVIGMNVFTPSHHWDGGGPLIMHSQWWLRAHWGRAFEIVELTPGDVTAPPPLFSQSVLVLRKRPGELTIEELERPEEGEPREFAALRQNIGSLSREIERHSIYLRSRSWRMTAPIRRAAIAWRRWRARSRGSAR
jgi:SAM-dependent methyltransferase